eukprot:233918-Prorocentrum_minimum.AAC.1
MSFFLSSTPPAPYWLVLAKSADKSAEQSVKQSVEQSAKQSADEWTERKAEAFVALHGAVVRGRAV